MQNGKNKQSNGVHVKHLKENMTLKYNEVPFEFQDKFIIKGYRHPNSTFIACCKSLFNLNSNETLNVWTHLIPSIIIIIYMSINYNLFYDNYAWPFILHVSSAAFFLLLSSIAHTFNCMSSLARHLCFLMDYFGIAIFGMASVISFSAYSLTPMQPYMFIFLEYYAGLSLIIIMFACILLSESRFVISFGLRSFLRAFPVVMFYLVAGFPLVFRLLQFYYPVIDKYVFSILKYFQIDSIKNVDLLDHYLHDETSINANFYHFMHFLFIILSVSFYASHMPERCCPGVFDTCGQSHNLFHISIAMAVLMELRAVYLDMQHLRPYLSKFFDKKTHDLILNSQNEHKLSFNFYTHSIKHFDLFMNAKLPFLNINLQYTYAILILMIFCFVLLIYCVYRLIYYNPWKKFN